MDSKDLLAIMAAICANGVVSNPDHSLLNDIPDIVEYAINLLEEVNNRYYQQGSPNVTGVKSAG